MESDQPDSTLLHHYYFHQQAVEISLLRGLGLPCLQNALVA
jgi:hypothetical protein